MTTKTIFNAVGGFNVAIPVGEDIDYSFRAAGFKPAGTLSAQIPFSARRFIQYGYGKTAWEYLRGGLIFATTGKMGTGKEPYPFGDY